MQRSRRILFRRQPTHSQLQFNLWRAAALMLPNAVQAQQAEGGASGSVDTEHIFGFGFTEGSDIGEKGEKEVDHSSYVFLGKQGSFATILNENDFRYGVDNGFRASFN